MKRRISVSGTPPANLCTWLRWLLDAEVIENAKRAPYGSVCVYFKRNKRYRYLMAESAFDHTWKCLPLDWREELRQYFLDHNCAMTIEAQKYYVAQELT